MISVPQRCAIGYEQQEQAGNEGKVSQIRLAMTTIRIVVVIIIPTSDLRDVPLLENVLVSFDAKLC